MSDYTEQASRVNDPIAHSSNDYAIGLSITVIAGGVLAIAFTPVTAGGSAMLILAIANEARGIGESIDTHMLNSLDRRELPRDSGEKITSAADTVFIDEVREEAAKASVLTTVDHGSFVQSGSDSILIEKCYASRIGDQASCGGFVSWGSETVFYGGTKKTNPDANENPPEQKRGDLYATYGFALDVVGLFSPPRGTEAIDRLKQLGYAIGAASNFDKYVLGGQSPALATAGSTAGRLDMGHDIASRIGEAMRRLP